MNEDMHTVGVNADELRALRRMAVRGLELSQMVDDGDLVRRRPPRPRDTERFTRMELDLIQRLIEARGEAVPYDRLIKYASTTGIHAAVDEWNTNPATQVSWARRKLRLRFDSDCIGTVWNTRVNRRGHVVRDYDRGIVGYRWTGPDIQGMALGLAAELGLTAEDDKSEEA